MKIGIDATPLTVATGGIARYTRELALALARCFPDDQLWLVSDQAFPVFEEQPISLRRYQASGGILERRWWLFGLPRLIQRLGLDVFHGTDFAVPYFRLRPAVMTVHDLSPWKNEPWRSPSERVRSRTPLLLRAGLATMIIAPSQAIRHEVIDWFRFPADRVVAIPMAPAPSLRPSSGRALPQPYFLFVGTLEPRKNLIMLVEAWREVRRTCSVELVIAGRLPPDAEPIPPEPGLHYFDTVPDADLPDFYSGALAVLLPSFYEGFGITVLEAMQCGAAVFASDDPALQETGGDAALYLDPNQARQWIEAMTHAVQDTAWLAALRAKGLQRAGEFTWDRTARLTREVYVEAVRRFRR